MWGPPGGGETLGTYRCPHWGVMGADHRVVGWNVDQTLLAQAWSDGWGAAYMRMLEEAADAGAHGVVGITDTVRRLEGQDVLEYHIYGTAVRVTAATAPAGTPAGVPAGPGGAAPAPAGATPTRASPSTIWTSYAAGQRLAKLLEAGLQPISVVAAMASVRVWAVCSTLALMRGWDPLAVVRPGDEAVQLSDAQMEARRRARDRVRQALGADSLHGASMSTTTREPSEGVIDVNCVLRGTRVRKVRDAEPLPAPVPTVRLR
jgi:uncharacterized protein YbjQ (UPF0145 family)